MLLARSVGPVWSLSFLDDLLNVVRVSSSGPEGDRDLDCTEYGVEVKATAGKQGGDGVRRELEAFIGGNGDPEVDEDRSSVEDRSGASDGPCLRSG